MRVTFPGRGSQWMGLWTKLTRPSARGSWFKHTFTLSSYFDFHFQFVEAGSITLSSYFNFHLQPVTAGSNKSSSPLSPTLSIASSSLQNFLSLSFCQVLSFTLSPKQVTSEWGSYLRSYKLEQDIFPGSQITSALLHSVSLISG